MKKMFNHLRYFELFFIVAMLNSLSLRSQQPALLQENIQEPTITAQEIKINPENVAVDCEKEEVNLDKKYPTSTEDSKLQKCKIKKKKKSQNRLTLAALALGGVATVAGGIVGWRWYTGGGTYGTIKRVNKIQHILVNLKSGLDSTCVANALFGAAAGDALGKRTEFVINIEGLKGLKVEWFDSPDIRKTNLPNGLQICPYTDDTVMAHIVFEELCKHWQNKEEAVNFMARRFVQLFGPDYLIVDPLHDIRAHGGTGPRSCEIIKDKVASFENWQDWRNGTLNSDNIQFQRGCGSVMRVWPVGLFYDVEEAIQVADWQSRITHRHPSAVAACAAVAAGFATLRLGGTFDEVADTMINVAGRYVAEEQAQSGNNMATGVDTANKDVVRQLMVEGHLLTRDMFRYAKWAATVGNLVPGEVLGTHSGQSSGITQTGDLLGWVGNEAAAAFLYVLLRHPYKTPAEAEQIFKAALSEAVKTVGDSDSIATLVGAFMGYAYNGQHPKCLLDLPNAKLLERWEWISEVYDMGNVLVAQDV